MKEVVVKNIKYLLSYKLNSSDTRYEMLLEKIIYEFLTNMDSIYNKELETSSYYNFLLNRINKNIKSFIPSKEFIYHPSGFLELGTSLKNKMVPYENENIQITSTIKEELLKSTYFSLFVQAIKNNNQQIGWKEEHLSYLNKLLTELQAITLTKMNKFFKKEYDAIYPDGTSHEYFVYTKCLACSEILNINAIAMIEVLVGKTELMTAAVNGDTELWKEFDLRYSHLLGNMSSQNGKKKYTASSLLNELLRRVEITESIPDKLRYFKCLNDLVFELYDYKVTMILNQKEKEKIELLQEEIKVLESNMLYNKEPKLNSQMRHIETLKQIKLKLVNYQKQKKEEVETEYTIYSLDKKKQDVVKSSVQPIHVDNKYVTMHILEVKNVHNRVLVRINFNVIDYNNFTTKIYGNLYVSLKELKHLYSSSDLGVFTKESEVIRSAIANRLLNPTIMDIIKTERHNFLGEFTYSKEEDRCVIYKNKSIEELLKKVM